MELIMLGTGNALAKKCYNTCFVIKEDDNYFLVDGGGGNEILNRLDKANIDVTKIKNIFISHKHIDHILGLLWVIRLILTAFKEKKIDEDVYIYGHDEVIKLLKDMSMNLITKSQSRFIDDKLHFIEVKDNEKRLIINHEVIFFDIHSTKDKQFGFTFKLNDNDKLTCLGDEPFNINNKEYVLGSKWLLHEAFCLEKEEEIYHPKEISHSSVKDAALIAQKLNIKNLVLYHTKDNNLENRKALYSENAARYFKGNIFVPDDLEVIEL